LNAAKGDNPHQQRMEKPLLASPVCQVLARLIVLISSDFYHLQANILFHRIVNYLFSFPLLLLAADYLLLPH
ncbi:MAG: hypothetical protein AAGK05_16820, partial [Pseudomonadota bacterium]